MLYYAAFFFLKEMKKSYTESDFNNLKRISVFIAELFNLLEKSFRGGKPRMFKLMQLVTLLSKEGVFFYNNLKSALGAYGELNEGERQEVVGLFNQTFDLEDDDLEEKVETVFGSLVTIGNFL